MHNLTLAVPLVLAALPLPAQALLQTHWLPPGQTIVGLRSAGDTNGDGTQDLVAITRQPAGLVIASGRTGAPLHSLPEPLLANEREAFGIGDVNGDNRSDVVLIAKNLVRVYSGATGTVLASLPFASQLEVSSGCPVGDRDGNGTADIVVAAASNVQPFVVTLSVLRGENLSLIMNLPPLSNIGLGATIRAVGDHTGDGTPEIALCPGSGVPRVMNGLTGSTLWSAPWIGVIGIRYMDALDLDGDGRSEVFLSGPTGGIPGFDRVLSVLDGATGAERFARLVPNAEQHSTFVAGVGDLDQDGTQDFAQNVTVGGIPSSQSSTIVVSSGASGRRLWTMPNWVPGQPTGAFVAALGDVNADSFGDFAVNGFAGAVSGWHLLSGKLLAEAQPQAGACGGGPFFPQLGMTRPILGQTLTIAGLNAPTGVPGLLVFSLQPPAPTWLGASSCYAYFDLGSGVALASTTTTQWSLPIALPLAPQIAGLEIALQSIFSPTSGALGYDLSNGVWARLGYQ